MSFIGHPPFDTTQPSLPFCSGVTSLMSMLTLLIILLVLSAVFGGWGHRRWGYTGWSPLGIIVVLLLVLWLTGNLR